MYLGRGSDPGEVGGWLGDIRQPSFASFQRPEEMPGSGVQT